MKKLIAVALAVALVITLFAVVGPVSAGQPPPEERTVFETSLVPQLQNVAGPGDPYSSVSLDEGEVKVYADGGYKVEIKGLRVDGDLFTPDKDLDVLIWDCSFSSGWGTQRELVTAIEFLPVEDGEGTIEVEAGEPNSIPDGDHPAFFVQLNDGGVAWLLVSGFNIPEAVE